jgi:hypothetical protein
MGSARAWTEGEHAALYQSFDFQQQGVQMKGTIVAWYCDDSERITLFIYLTNPEIPDQDLAARMQAHLDSFSCHATD